MNKADVIRLLHDYNSNPKAYNDDDADIIANLAKSYGVGFKRSGKAGQKFLFELADTALLGMIPNEWRPEARGDKYFGETGLDRVASAGGMIGGAFAGGLGAFAGRHMAGRAVGKGLGYAQHYGPKALGKGMEYAGRGYSKASDLGSRAMAQGKKIYAEGPSLAGRAGAKFNEGVKYTRRKSTNLSSLNRGRTSYLGKLRDEFMEPYRNQNLLDMMDEVRRGIPMGGYG